MPVAAALGPRAFVSCQVHRLVSRSNGDVGLRIVGLRIELSHYRAPRSVGTLELLPFALRAHQ